MDKEIKEIIDLIKRIKDHVSIENCDVTQSFFNSKEEIIDEIDDHIERLSNSDLSKINDLILLFLPTSDFQEISISNGWSEEYLQISAKFDELITLIKNRK